MYVVIGGIGLVGGELARRLIENKHDVVVIDNDKEVCDRIYAETGVIALHGNVSQVDTLREANVQKADVVAATTGSDADNLACAILAKSFGVPDVIARMRNPHYEKAYKLVGVTSVLHVTDLMVNQMIIEIEKPRVRRVLSVGGGKADIYAVVIPKTARVAGNTVESIAKHPDFPPKCVFVAVFNRERDELTIPRGQQVIHQGDELLLISPAEDMRKVTDFLLG
jgi:trk system potassium uptake protein TrkA